MIDEQKIKEVELILDGCVRSCIFELGGIDGIPDHNGSSGIIFEYIYQNLQPIHRYFIPCKNHIEYYSRDRFVCWRPLGWKEWNNGKIYPRVL